MLTGLLPRRCERVSLKMYVSKFAEITVDQIVVAKKKIAKALDFILFFEVGIFLGKRLEVRTSFQRVSRGSSLNSLRKCPPPPPQILNFGQGSVVDTRGVP